MGTKIFVEMIRHLAVRYSTTLAPFSYLLSSMDFHAFLYLSMLRPHFLISLLIYRVSCSSADWMSGRVMTQHPHQLLHAAETVVQYTLTHKITSEYTEVTRSFVFHLSIAIFDELFTGWVVLSHAHNGIEVCPLLICRVKVYSSLSSLGSRCCCPLLT